MSKNAPAQPRLTNAEAYRELARSAADMVATYNSRAQWFAVSGEEQIAAEYRQLAQEAAARSQRYESLAHLGDKGSQETEAKSNH